MGLLRTNRTQLSTYRILDATLLDADFNASAAIARSKLAEDALAIYGIPIQDIKAKDGADLAIAETVDDHFASFSSNIWLLQGEEAISEVETSESSFQFVLPLNYVAAGTVKLRLKHQATGAGTLGATKTIDVECYEQDGNGVKGGDLNETGAATVVKDSWTTSDFTITYAGLVAGDILNFKIITAIQETGASALAIQIDGIAVLLDVKG